MDHKIRLNKDGVVHIRFKQDPVAMVKGTLSLEVMGSYCGWPTGVVLISHMLSQLLLSIAMTLMLRKSKLV